MTPVYKQIPDNVKITKKLVEGYGRSALADYGMGHVEIEWTNTKRRLGCARFIDGTPTQIDLSEWAFSKMPDKRLMIDVVLHEVAHIIAGPEVRRYRSGRKRGQIYLEWHGRSWKLACLKIGARPNATFDSGIFFDGSHKYSLHCKTHGYMGGFSRKPKRSYSCEKCSRRYNEKYKLQVVQNW